MLAVQLCCARHCELPLSKMGNKGLSPGVAVPLAFFCTLFFRHRKKSVSAPWDGKSQFAPESARQAPPKGNFLGRGFSLRSKQGGFLFATTCYKSCKSFSLRSKQGGFPLAPLPPFGSPTEAIERPIWLQALLPRRSRRVRPRRKISPRLNACTKKRKPHAPRRFRFPIYFRG